MKVGDRMHSFTVTKIRKSEELRGTLTEMTHDRTGTQLAWLDNGLKNKLFAVAFRTFPEDSTGVFHILEHSVLCGSAKYPVREPFVELLKGSMNTFLNAMTGPDMTVYPVSSRNDRDFLNLTEVYLDAVFAPKMLTDANIFYQEGWHIERDENGKPCYKGVVFNEMKGAMSSMDSLIEEKMLQMLFPDNCYGFNSGGDPEVIPTLTLEKFRESYRKFYHPSNARIYLDGAVPLDEALALIDSYLGRFERLRELPGIGVQTPKSTDDHIVWEIGAEEDAENRCQLVLGKILSTWKDSVKNAAARMLSIVLAGTNESPLKRAILESGLCQDMSLDVDDSVAQPYLTLHFRNITDGKEKELRELLRTATERILAEGIDKEALRAAYNRFVFQVRETEEPQGLYRFFTALPAWCQGGDVLDAMTHEKTLAALKEMIPGTGFEELLREMLLDERGLCVLTAAPSKTIGEEKRKAEEAAVSKIVSAWSARQEEENRSMVEDLVRWQATPDGPEQLATLPKLSLDEVDREPYLIPTEEGEQEGVTVLTHRVNCPGIAHIKAYFSLTDASLSELTELSLLGQLMGKLPTAAYSGAELEKALRNTVGRMSFSVTVVRKREETHACAPMLCVQFSALEENLEAAEELAAEILLHTDFGRADRIRETVLQAEHISRQQSVMAGHLYGRLAVVSGFSAAGAAGEALRGAAQLKWLHAFARSGEADFAAYGSRLADIVKRAACRERMILTAAAAEEKNLSGLIALIPHGSAAPEWTDYIAETPRRLGLRIPAQIGFACTGIAPRENEWAYDGSMSVAANILSLDYLWNRVRVQGGAYGTGLSVSRSGGFVTYSYRDPTPAGTLKTYEKLGPALREFAERGEDVEKYIISTIAEKEPLLSPRDEGDQADSAWLSGYRAEDDRTERAQILATTREKLLAAAGALDHMASPDAVCVVAYDGALKECGALETEDL